MAVMVGGEEREPPVMTALDPADKRLLPERRSIRNNGAARHRNGAVDAVGGVAFIMIEQKYAVDARQRGIAGNRRSPP